MAKASNFKKNIKLWQELTEFYVDLGAQKVWIWFAIVLGSLSLLSNVVSFIYLIPLLQGMITKNFDFLNDNFFLKIVIQQKPQFFASYESRFVLLVSLVFLLALVRSISLYFSRIITVRQVYVVDIAIKNRLFQRYLRFNKNFYDKYSTGSIYYTLMDESKRVSNQLRNLMELCLKVLTLSAYFSLLLTISLELSVVTALVFGVMGVFSNRIVEKVKYAIRKFHYYEKKISERTHDTILCIPVVKTFGKESQEMEYFRQTNQNTATLAVEGEVLGQIINPVKEVFSLMALLLIAFALSYLNGGLGGTHSVSHYLVFFMIVRFSSPIFNQLSQNWINIMTAEKSLRNIKNLLEQKETSYLTKEGSHILPAIVDSIEFRSINLRLGNRTIFENLNFSIPIGKRVAIVGVSGIGKSTIVNLLLREYDLERGQLLLDGKDVQDYSSESVKRQFSVVAQDSFLFETTIRKNLLYGAQGEVSDQELEKSIRRSQLSEFISKLPNGLDTELGERGMTVSGGEKQRIVIARAFLRNSPIMIFDEPTSSLDSANEQLVKEAIFSTTRNRTAIIITHKLEVIKDVDFVLLLTEDGRCIQGKFEDLFEKSDDFQRSIEKQTKAS